MPFRPSKHRSNTVASQLRRGLALRTLSLAALAAGSIFTLPALKANTELDVNAGATDLTSAGSYTPSMTPTTAYDVTFAAGTTYTTPGAFTIGSSISFGSLNDLNATAITISNTGGTAASVLTLGGAGDTGDSVTGSNSADLLYVATGANLTITGGTGNAALGLNLAQTGNLDVVGTAAISAIVSGSNGLTKTGAGTLTLSGANTYTGGTNVNAGILNIGVTGVNGDTFLGGTGVSNVVTINGGALQGGTTNSSVTISANHGIVIGASGGTLTTNGGDNGNGIVFNNANTLSGSGNLTLTGNNGSANNTILVGAAQNLSGNIYLNDRIQLTSSTATLGTGALYIASGTALGTGTTFGTSTTGQVYVTQTTGTVTLANAIFLNGNGNDGRGAFRVQGPGLTLNGNITLQSNSYISGTIADTITLNGTTTGAFTLNLGNSTGSSASANYVLVGADSATTTYINSGSLTLGASTAAQGTTLSGATGGTVKFATGIGTFSAGSLAGGEVIGLADTGGTAVSLAIGSTNVSTTYSGVLSGTGSLTKTGTGVQTLSGANTYSGTTTISGGTLQLGAGGTTGSLATTSAITDNGTLGFNRTNTVTQGTDFNAAALTGTGGLAKAGSGSLVLNAANTFSGGVVATAGTIQLASASTVTGGSLVSGPLGTGAYSVSATTTDLNGFNLSNALVSGGNGDIFTNTSATAASITSGFNQTGAASVVISDFTVQGTGDINWSGAIRRTNFTGTVTKSGTNTLTLSGAGGDYTNMAYNVTGGNLAFNLSGGTFNSGNIAVATGTGVIGAEATGTISTIAPVISGAGTFTQSGAGTTVLTGANTYSGGTTISAGTFQLGDGTTNGTFAGNITDNSALVFNYGTATSPIYAGIISGSGSVTKTGPGTITLGGANTYTGNLQVQNGVLNLNNGSNTTFLTNSAGTGTVTLGASGAANNTVVSLSNASRTFANAIATTGTGGTNTIQVSGGGQILTFSGGVTLGNNFTFSTVNGSDAINETGAIGGTGNLVTSVSTTGLGGNANGTGLTSGGTITLSNNVNNAGTVTNNGNGTAAVTISGVIGTNVTGVIQNAANSPLSLSGTSTYTGPTTVTAGLLTVTSTGSINGSTSVQVSSVGALTLANSTALSNVGTLSLVSGSALTLGAANGTSETIGSLILNGNVEPTGTYDMTSFYTLAGSSGINFTSSFGETLTVTAVPEPSTWVGGLLGLGALTFRLRRRFTRVFADRGAVV